MNLYFITGPSKGLGKAITEKLLEDETNIVIGISRTKSIEHKRYHHINLDFNHTDSVLDSSDQIFNNRVDGNDSVYLINNAGYLGPLGHLGSVTGEELAKAYRINCIAPAILINSFITTFKDHSMRKVVLNISSGAAKNPYDGWAAYCSTKAALDMVTRVAAVENEIDGNDILMLSLAPGIIETGMQEKIRKTDENQFSNVSRFIELKENDQLQRPEEAADKIISYLQNAGPQTEVIQDIRDLN